MSLLDAILGRDRPVRSKTDALFSLTTAQLTLETVLDLAPTNHAALSFRPVSNAEWTDVEQEMSALLEVSTKDSPLQWRWYADDYGFKWIILQAAEFENLVATVHMLGDELISHGFGEQLLAALFQFRNHEQRTIYLIYNYKRGTFYPFVPDPNRPQERLNAVEFRISGALQKDLPIEKEIDKWYPLWGVPL
jgi:hypothetical protein